MKSNPVRSLGQWLNPMFRGWLANKPIAGKSHGNSKKKREGFISGSIDYISFSAYAIVRTQEDFIFDSVDYISLSALELLVHEIQNLPGCVAELGAFGSGFAPYINRCFPDRTLYLFDVVEGDGAGHEPESLMDAMRYPANVHIKKGRFPETAQGVEEKFVFVHITADLFQPIYDGLRFFFPRLQPGGAIWVDDYSYAKYTGAKEAIKKFAAEFNAPHFPLEFRAVLSK